MLARYAYHIIKHIIKKIRSKSKNEVVLLEIIF